MDVLRPGGQKGTGEVEDFMLRQLNTFGKFCQRRGQQKGLQFLLQRVAATSNSKWLQSSQASVVSIIILSAVWKTV